MSGFVGTVRGAAPAFDLAGLLAAVQTWRARRREIIRLTRELETYSDRELADLGLVRSDIPDVARGAFARA